MPDKQFIKVPADSSSREVIIAIDDIVLVKRSKIALEERSIITVARGNFSESVDAPWSLEEVGSRLSALMDDDPQIS